MLFEYPFWLQALHAERHGGITIAVTLIDTAVFAGWGYGLHRTARGSRGALITTCVLNALVWLVIPVGWIAAWCTGDCPTSAGISFNIANWLNLIFGLLAAAALVLELRHRTAVG